MSTDKTKSDAARATVYKRVRVTKMGLRIGGGVAAAGAVVTVPEFIAAAVVKNGEGTDLGYAATSKPQTTK